MNDPETPPSASDPDEPRVGPDIDFTDPNSSLAPYYFRTSHVLATLLIVVVFLFFNLMTPLWHSDIWGHLKIGEWIIANRQLPERELFSPFSDPTLPASNFQWLSQVVLSCAFEAGEWLAGGSPLERTAGGIDMLRFVHALCEGFKALFLLLAFRRFTGSLPWAIFGVIFVFAFSLAPSAIQRPQVFAEALFAVVLRIMARPLWRAAGSILPSPPVLRGRGAGGEGDEPSQNYLSWRQSLAIVAILVLWANVHGSFLMGVALVGVFWLGQLIESIRAKANGSPAELLAPSSPDVVGQDGEEEEGLDLSRQPKVSAGSAPSPPAPLPRSTGGEGRWFSAILLSIRDVPLQRPLVAIVLGTVLLSFLSPHGLRAIPDVLAFAKNPNILTMQEWRPLDFSAGGGGHWGYLVLFVLIVFTQIVSTRIYSPTQLLLLAIFGVVPIFQERLMTWWIMLVPVIILPMWADLLVVTDDFRERFTSVLSLRKTIVAVGIVLVGAIWSSPVQLLLGHPPVPIHLSASRATLWPVTQELLDGVEASADAKTLKENALARAIAGGLKNYPGQKFQGRIFTPEAMGDYLVWSLPAKAPVLVYSHVHAFAPDFWDDTMEVLFARPGWRTVLDRERVNLIICQTEQRQDLLDALRADSDWDVILDQSEQPLNRWYRLFVALRKKPIGNDP